MLDSTPALTLSCAQMASQAMSTADILCNGAMQDSIPLGKAVMVAEVCRPSPSATSADVAALAVQYVQWGADAVAVCTDLEETPSGLSDLFAVCRAVRVPVLQTDWFLHPLQVRYCSQNYTCACVKTGSLSTI